jgi:hypothetical protein
MTASVAPGSALRYAEGSARGLLNHPPGYCQGACTVTADLLDAARSIGWQKSCSQAANTGQCANSVSTAAALDGRGQSPHPPRPHSRGAMRTTAQVKASRPHSRGAPEAYPRRRWRWRPRRVRLQEPTEDPQQDCSKGRLPGLFPFRIDSHVARVATSALAARMTVVPSGPNRRRTPKRRSSPNGMVWKEIFVTHNVEVAIYIADRVRVLHMGKGLGPPTDIGRAFQAWLPQRGLIFPDAVPPVG